MVEDNPGDVRLVSLALEGLGTAYQMKKIGTGAEALDFLYKKGLYSGEPRPDVVFLDLHLPKMGGGEVLREMRRCPELKEIPVVVITGEAFDEECAEDLSADFVLLKPLSPQHFSIVVNALKKILSLNNFPEEL